MNKIKLLFFGASFGASIVVIMSQPLYSAPVYAAELENPETGQHVFLYGDIHDTHLSGGIQEERDIAEAFVANLEKIISDPNVSFLHENYGSHRYDYSLWVNTERISFFREDPRESFISLINQWAWASKNSRKTLLGKSELNEISLANIKSIDRREWLITKDLMEWLQDIDEDSEVDLTQQERRKSKKGRIGKSFERIFNIEITKKKLMLLFTAPIEYLEKLKHKAKNPTLKSKISKMQERFEVRQELIFQKYPEISRISHWNDNHSLAAEFFRKPVVFEILLHLFSSHKMICYDSEMVDLEGLYHIVEQTDIKKKIIVFAGLRHIDRLENYLIDFGYSKIRETGIQHDKLKNSALEKSRCEYVYDNYEDSLLRQHDKYDCFLYYFDKETIGKKGELRALRDNEKKFNSIHGDPSFLASFPKIIPIEVDAFDWMLDPVEDQGGSFEVLAPSRASHKVATYKRKREHENHEEAEAVEEEALAAEELVVTSRKIAKAKRKKLLKKLLLQRK